MKTLLLTAMIIIAGFATAQTNYNTSTEAPQLNIAMYIVGCETMPEYKVEIKTCSTEGQVILDNGKRVPALNCFIVGKDDYIGGELVSGKRTTEIVDIFMESFGEEDVRFVVRGKTFDMGFTLINGIILKIEDDEAVFYTEGKGVWVINKKV